MSEYNQCPKCGSTDVGGLVEAYWTPINQSGEPKRPLHESVEGETEVGPSRICYCCDHEWGNEPAAEAIDKGEG